VSRPRDPELDTKIIEAATEEFHTVGYGAMSLGSIAVRAGVRPGAFTIPSLALMGTEEANEVRDLIRDDMARNRHMELLRPALKQAVAAGVLPDNVSVSYASAMILGAYFTFRLGVDSEHWPADMPEKLLQTLGAKTAGADAN
jgi:AcrR family transcriptional regulator